MGFRICLAIAAGGLVAAASDPPPAHPLAPFAMEGSSRVTAHDDVRTLENVGFQFIDCGGDRTSSLRRVLRQRVTMIMNTEDIGRESRVRVDAFDLAAGAAAPPVYSIDAEGSGAAVMPGGDDCLLALDAGFPDVSWTTVYDLEHGKKLFETEPNPLVFRIQLSGPDWRSEAVGLQVPPDDEKDPALADKHVVGLLTLVQGHAVQSRALLVADDVKMAARLRNYADERRTLDVVDARSGAVLAESPAEQPLSRRPLAVAVVFADAKLAVRVPFTADGLAIDRATLPKGLRLVRAGR